MNYLKRTWAEIWLDNVKYNWEQIKKSADGRFICPVIKADAYGHGADYLAKFYQENGADYFAVSNINEAIKLRESGITTDILILGYTPIENVELLIKYNITQTVFCYDYCLMLSKVAVENNSKIKVHIKLDTGMCRIGFNARTEEFTDIDSVINCLKLPNLYFEGIMTHFSSADSISSDDIAFSDKQYSLFMNAVNTLKSNGYNFKFIHCCNSGATALRSTNNGNFIRPGIILYGLSPAFSLDIGYTPKPIMSLKSSVAMIKEINVGDAVSYGRTFISDKKMLVATIPVGYADGYPRALSNCGKVLINGKFANIIGRVCMDQITVDISDIDNVQIGTEVVLIGNQGNNSITFDDIAMQCNTISYEIMCNISVRVPRVYIEDNNVIEVAYLGGKL